MTTKKDFIFSGFWLKNKKSICEFIYEYIHVTSVTHMRFFAIALSCHLDFRCMILPTTALPPWRASLCTWQSSRSDVPSFIFEHVSHSNIYCQKKKEKIWSTHGREQFMFLLPSYRSNTQPYQIARRRPLPLFVYTCLDWRSVNGRGGKQNFKSPF